MAEIWDGYLIDGSLAGRDLVRGEAIPEGLYHMVCEIIVRHVDGDYLLMQRDVSKPNYGGYYEVTAGGAVLKGENKLEGALRELREETGIVANELEEIGQNTSRETIYFDFLCITDCDKGSITLQEGETMNYKWLSEKEFISFVNSKDIIDSQRVRYNDFFVKMGYV